MAVTGEEFPMLLMIERAVLKIPLNFRDAADPDVPVTQSILPRAP